jgi:hypothetical protein
MAVTLADEFRYQQERVRDLLGIYKSIGAAGVFGATAIEHALRLADKAVAEGDTVAMIRLLPELQAFE